MSERREKEARRYGAAAGFLGLVAGAAGAFAVLTGLLVLAGWAFDVEVLKRVVPGLNAMNPVTAVAFVLTGLALFLLRSEGAGRVARGIGRGFALAVALVGLVKLLQVGFGWEFGVDQLLFREKLDVGNEMPNRIGYVVALNLVLLGGALLLLDRRTRRGLWPAQYLALAAALTTFLPILGYVYGVESFYGTLSYVAVALHTALVFLVLSVGVLCARPGRGMMAVVVGEGPGGVMARRLLPAAFFLTAILGWLSLKGQRAGLYGAGLGEALFVIADMVVLAALIGWSARSLYRSDTERRRVEEDRQRLEWRNRLILDSAGEGIFGLNPDGNISFVNPAAARMLGHEPRDLVGRSMHDAAHHSRLDGSPYPVEECPIYRALRNAEVHREAEEVFWRRDGTSFPVEYTSTPITGDGGVAGSVVTLRDVTERKKAEEELREAEERFRGAFEDAPIGMALVGFDGRWLQVNRSLCEIVGYPEDELLRLAFQDITHPDDLEADVGYLRELFDGGIRSYQMEKRYLHKTGCLVWVMLSVSLVTDAANRPLYVVSQIEDITERKEAEKEIRRQAELLSTLHETSLGLMNRLDLNAVLNEISGHAAKLLDAPHGYVATVEPGGEELVVRMGLGKARDYIGLRLEPGEGLSGKVWQAGEPVVLNDPYDSWSERSTKTASTGINAMAAVPIRSGEEVVGVIGVFDDREGRAFGGEEVTALEQLSGLAAVALDNARLYATAQEEIAERRLAEEKLRAFGAELQRSNRELQDFAYVASHDLQEPLRKVRAFGDRLKAKHADGLDARGLDYLERMQNAAGRMQTLIEDLLTFSRVTTQARPFVKVDLSKVVREVLSDLSLQIERTGGRVEVSGLPAIVADPTQMRQLFQNLISNALKFRCEDEPPVVRIQGSVLDGRCEILVEDNGIGFEQDYAGRIFTIFERLHSRTAYEGTGVGLAVCKKIAERHGGDIAAKGAPGEGAAFTVTLPVRQRTEVKSDGKAG